MSLGDKAILVKAILVDRKVIPIDTVDIEMLKRWARSFEKNRIVAQTMVGGVSISTVFLGLDHGYGSKPLWFETMVFGGVLNDLQERYRTFKQAQRGHNKIVGMVKKAERSDREQWII